MDQLEETVLITRAKPRAFGKKEWALVSDLLGNWEKNIDAYIDIVEKKSVKVSNEVTGR